MTDRSPFLIFPGLVVGLGLCGVSPATAQDADSLNPMRVVEKSALKGFLERPLFDPTRRLPPVAPEMPVVAEAPVAARLEPPPALHLLGVIHGLRDMAIVHRDGDTKTIILRTRDRFDGWTVTVLPPVGVRLSSGKRAFDYVLFANPGVSVGPVAVAPDAGTGNTTEMSEALAAHNARLQKRTY